MKAQVAITSGVLTLFTIVPAACADTYSSTTTTTEQSAPITEYRTIERPTAVTEYRTTTLQQAAPLTEMRTTTVESSPATVVRETPVYVEPSQSTTTIIKERRRHHHLLKLPFVSVD